MTIILVSIGLTQQLGPGKCLKLQLKRCACSTQTTSLKRYHEKQTKIQTLNELEKQLAEDPHSFNLQRRVLQLKHKIGMQEIKQAQGAIIRSRTKWMEELRRKQLKIVSPIGKESSKIKYN